MTTTSTKPAAATVAARVHALDWLALAGQLDERALRSPTRSSRRRSAASWPICLMGTGFARRSIWRAIASATAATATSPTPLPRLIEGARGSFYEHLAPIANAWSDRPSGPNPKFPATHPALPKRCRAAGQKHPTPLILRYREGDWNALHQDLYGEVYFPFEILIVLSDPGEYDGGEFVLVEQRPRAQSQAHVLRPAQGAFVIFPTRERPNPGKRGYHRVSVRHGVSTVTSGQRTALGIIFHDAN